MPFETLLTVLTPSASRDLTTLAQVAAESSVTVESLSDGPELIAFASDVVVGYTGREWVRESVRQTFRGDGRRVNALILERAPVTTLSSVSVDGMALNLATEVEYDARLGALYRLDLDSRIEWGGRVVLVEYTAGYISPALASSNMPMLIQRATAKIVAGWRAGQGRDPRLRSRTIEDVGAASWIDPKADDYGMPPGISALLDPHRWRRPG